MQSNTIQEAVIEYWKPQQQISPGLQNKDGTTNLVEALTNQWYKLQRRIAGAPIAQLARDPHLR